MDWAFEAARYAASIILVGQQFVGIEDPGFSGEYLGASVTNITGDGLAAGALFGYQRAPGPLWDFFQNSNLINRRHPLCIDLKAKLEPLYEHYTVQKSIDGENALSTGQDFITMGAGSFVLLAIAIVDALELTTGFGPPVDGGDFAKGAQKLSDLHEHLGNANPDDKWSGPAAEAYAAQNKAVLKLAAEMRDWDLELEEIVKKQADWVTHITLGLGILKNLLVLAYGVEIVITLRSGPLAGGAFGHKVALAGVGVALAMGGGLLERSSSHARLADAWAGRCRAGSGLLAGGGPAPIATAAPVESSSASAVGPTVGVVFSALASVDIVGVADAASGEMNERARSDAGAAAAAAELTMPTFGEVVSWSGEGATLSGRGSRHADLVNQTRGQAIKVAHPDQETTPVENALAEDGGAGVGAPAYAERAPVAAVGADSAGAWPAGLST